MAVFGKWALPIKRKILIYTLRLNDHLKSKKKSINRRSGKRITKPKRQRQKTFAPYKNILCSYWQKRIRRSSFTGFTKWQYLSRIPFSFITTLRIWKSLSWTSRKIKSTILLKLKWPWIISLQVTNICERYLYNSPNL